MFQKSRNFSWNISVFFRK